MAFVYIGSVRYDGSTYEFRCICFYAFSLSLCLIFAGPRGSALLVALLIASAGAVVPGASDATKGHLPLNMVPHGPVDRLTSQSSATAFLHGAANKDAVGAKRTSSGLTSDNKSMDSGSRPLRPGAILGLRSEHSMALHAAAMPGFTDHSMVEDVATNSHEENLKLASSVPPPRRDTKALKSSYTSPSARNPASFRSNVAPRIKDAKKSIEPQRDELPLGESVGPRSDPERHAAPQEMSIGGAEESTVAAAAKSTTNLEDRVSSSSHKSLSAKIGVKGAAKSLSSLISEMVHPAPLMSPRPPSKEQKNTRGERIEEQASAATTAGVAGAEAAAAGAPAGKTVNEGIEVAQGRRQLWAPDPMHGKKDRAMSVSAHDMESFKAATKVATRQVCTGTFNI